MVLDFGRVIYLTLCMLREMRAIYDYVDKLRTGSVCGGPLTGFDPAGAHPNTSEADFKVYIS